jgi:hypothetical protein
VIGSGTFGVVYRATWRGIPAAVKVVQLPGGLTAFDATGMQRTGSPAGPAAAAAAAGVRFEGLGGARERLAADRRSSRREQMAVMETALGSSLSHPNIVQVGSCACLRIGFVLAGVHMHAEASVSRRRCTIAAITSH